MRYIGQTFQIPCDRGGLNFSNNKTLMTPVSMVVGSKNLNLKGERKKRGGTARVNGTVITDAPQLMGIFDFLKPAGSQYIVFATDDGKLWKNTTNTIKTGLTIDKQVQMEQFGSKVYFCNGADVPTVWNGSDASTTDLTVGVAAQGTITMAGVAVADETFVIDDQTFTWKSSRSGEGEVTIGASAAAAVINIVDAITADLTTVTAVDGAGDTVVVTAASEGVAGNSIVFTEVSTNMTVNGSGTLGTTTSGVNDQVPADWTGGNYPSQMIKHGRGNSERLWAIGCLSTPYTIYASANGDGSNFGDVGVKTFNIDTGDGYGIVGAKEFSDKLFCFGRRKTYIIDDADTNTSNWGYDSAPWEGGAAHHRVIVKTPNDLICMAEDGEIYSVMAAMEYGDYKKASLTRATYMHDWIKDNLRLSYLSLFHTIYDPVLRAIKFFVVRTGQTTVDTALVYFIDRPPEEAWIIHDNLNFASGYNASCAGLIRVGAGDYQIYTGDYSGFIWKLEQSAKNDNDQAFWAGFKTPPLGLNEERGSERYDRGWLTIEPQGTEILSIDWWTSGTARASTTITAVSGERRYSFRLGAIGENIELQIYNNTKNTDFCINEIQLDFMPLGSRLK